MTPAIKLKRVHCGDVTLGVLIDDIPFAVTLEPPWKQNEIGTSCIPAGRYLCARVKSPKFGDVFEIMGVAGRSDVLFHWGNRLADTSGCVLVAEKFGRLAGKAAVLTSRNSPGEGFNELTQKMKGLQTFYVDIEWCCDYDVKTVLPERTQ